MSSASAPLPRTFQIGLRRAGGLSMVSTLSPHMNIVAMLCGHPSPFPAQDLLAPTLRAIHPPVQVVTLGGAYGDEDAAAVEAVWDAYRAEVAAKPEEYGKEGEGVKVGLVRVMQESVGEVQGERGGCEVYEAVAEVLIRGVKAL